MWKKRYIARFVNQGEQGMCAINDPLVQTHSPDSSDHYSHLKVILF